ncbi:hypothetical protein TSTA_089160 [Talaromyces stipitatus ATCC 10500]|uniref:Uncharacterized protein n=1 Tax=Talaromyces stipitatus (strain ATCC 10500 / CBS 375.48 / QM 6759 / NRRL 1006) TaxID=441959 RepID=B8LZC7_TALSN|nr:uncharacterized protein TSTA_089160 [Talaromyces stipitatus ATCC 10500]EED21680.1 hypothetical protein TSTA_089160 [Talaromyces stipitatus ATCC 10500]
MPQASAYYRVDKPLLSHLQTSYTPQIVVAGNGIDQVQSNEVINHIEQQHDGDTIKVERGPEFNYANNLNQDEVIRELDEIIDSARLAPTEETKAIIRDLTAWAGQPPVQPIPRLPCPFIIPQRRPRKRGRGFVRACAPVLADCGVSEGLFLQLLEDYDRVNEASHWIEVFYIAGSVLSLVPNLAAQITSAVVQVVADRARELQKRHR